MLSVSVCFCVYKQTLHKLDQLVSFLVISMVVIILVKLHKIQILSH